MEGSMRNVYPLFVVLAAAFAVYGETKPIVTTEKPSCPKLIIDILFATALLFVFSPGLPSGVGLKRWRSMYYHQ
jgi:hypothetical protein